MLRSLLILYPTVHQDGVLILHKEDWWTFDANALIPLQTPPSLAYVVTSGSLVSLITHTWFLVVQRSISRISASSDLIRCFCRTKLGRDREVSDNVTSVARMPGVHT